MIANGGLGHFYCTKEFVRLGAKVYFLIDDAADVGCRISTPTKEIGTLKLIWDTTEVPLKNKKKLCKTAPENLALWRSNK